jgi:hypothetical protein
MKIFINLILQNQLANFNQILYKSSLVKEIYTFSNKGPGPLQRGDNYKNEKMGWDRLKAFFLRTT